MPEKKQSNDFQMLVVITLVLAIAPLYFESMRELNLLNLQLLSGWNNEDTYVGGKRANYRDEFVPSVRYRESAKYKLQVEAETDIDAFLLAAVTYMPSDTFPDASAWQNSDLLEWGAIAVACEAYSNSISLEPNAHLYERALRVIEMAQNAHPDNGALWIAEALMHYGNKNPNAAIEALEQAAERTNWHAGTPEAYTQLKQRMEEKGFTAFDLAQSNYDVTRAWHAMRELQYFFEEQLTEAVVQDDTERFTSLVELLTRLGKCRIWHMNAPFPIIRISQSDELIVAIADHLGIYLEEDEVSHVSYDEEGREMFFEYVNQVAGPELAYDVTALELTYRMQIREWGYDSKDYQDWQSILCSAGGFFNLIGIVALALGIALLATDIPFTFTQRGEFVQTSVVRQPGFWTLSILVLLGTGALLYRATTQTFNPGGFKAFDTPELKDRAWAMLVIMAIPSAVLLLRLLAQYANLKSREHFRCACILPLMIYTVIIMLVAALRVSAVDNYDGRYSRDPAAYAKVLGRG